jgi:hypothetical protein
LKAFSVTIALVLCVSGCACAAAKPITSTTADLDGNGRKEKVWVTLAKVSKNLTDHSTLHVDKAEVPFYGEYDGLEIVDIDRSDRYKEIDVRTYSGSDAVDHRIYWYDGKSIQKTADLSWRVEYKGNGIVLNRASTCYVAITDKYVLDKKSRKLTLVPQEMYYVGTQHKVAQSFPIYYSRQSKSVVANVETNSTITVLVYVPNQAARKSPGKYDVMQEWFLIKTQSGLLGWVRLQTLSQYVQGMQGAG